MKINNEVRISNEKTLLEIGKNTSPTMLWSGAFKRLPGSASKASFGDQRTYMHNGTKIDEQTHMGQDLASVAHAPIPAANDGKVVFAEPLGIFGNLVIIDHGLGLQSLYSHMSEIQTNVGATVKKGDIIGLTGQPALRAAIICTSASSCTASKCSRLTGWIPSGSKTPLPIGLMPPGPNVKAD